MSSYYLAVLCFFSFAAASSNADNDADCGTANGPGWEWDGKEGCQIIPTPPKKLCLGGTNFNNPAGGEPICCKPKESVRILCPSPFHNYSPRRSEVLRRSGIEILLRRNYATRSLLLASHRLFR